MLSLIWGKRVLEVYCTLSGYPGYRFSLRYATKVFFLNNDDMVELTKLGAVNKHKQWLLVHWC